MTNPFAGRDPRSVNDAYWGDKFTLYVAGAGILVIVVLALNNLVYIITTH